VRDAAIALYEFGAAYALQRGIIIADTKFEFGLLDGELILIDEALTPDSSRSGRSRLRAGTRPAELRQAVSCATTSRRSLGQEGSGARTAARDRRQDGRQVLRGLAAAHRQVVGRRLEADRDAAKKGICRRMT